MGRHKRATIHSVWWKRQIHQVKFCVTCGDDLVRRYVREERHWRKLCGSCGSINYFNPRVVAGTVPVLNGKVVLGQRAIEPSRGCWGFPCGYVELGESTAEAAVRETREEISLTVKVRSLLGVYSYADAGVVTVVYLAQARGVQKPKPAHETLKVGLFSPSEIPWNRLAFRSTRDALEEWVESTLTPTPLPLGRGERPSPSPFREKDQG